MACDILKADAVGIARAARMILQGKVISFPTETFYGIGADALNAEALERIFDLKGREAGKPLLILIADRDWVRGFVREVPPAAGALMDKFWPGPLSLVFDASRQLPGILTGGTHKIGLRVSSHPVARALVKEAGRAITATSANRSGEPSLQNPREVTASLGERLDAVLDGGQTAGGLGSTVLDVTVSPPKMLRPGAVPESALADFLKV